MIENEQSTTNASDLTEAPPYRSCIAFDFDGVIHSYEYGWQNGIIYGNLDLCGIEMAWEEGYAVAIVTTRSIRGVCDALPDAWRVALDLRCEYQFWNGGETGREILVTNRKIAAVAYVDDRGVAHLYGDNWKETFRSINALRDRNKN